MLKFFVNDLATFTAYNLKSNWLVIGLDHYIYNSLADRYDRLSLSDTVFFLGYKLKLIKVAYSYNNFFFWTLGSYQIGLTLATMFTLKILLVLSISIFELFWDSMIFLSAAYWLFMELLTHIGSIITRNEIALSSSIHLFWMFFILSTVISFIFYMFLGIRGFILLNILGIVPFWIISSCLFNWFFIKDNSIIVYIGDFNVIGLGDKVPFKFLFNKLTFGFGYLTLSIGMFVLIYSFFYFRGEPTKERLSFFLMMFVNSMLVLIYSDNLIITFLGWELIGIMSFFLINHWSSRPDTLKAAFKALAYNLLSDFFLLCAFLLIFNVFGSLEISVIYMKIQESLNKTIETGHTRHNAMCVISILLLLGSSVKSAQFFFHTWLPDSMEAPAPASALIHSATLVSAGIFLLTRLQPLWTGTSLWLGVTTVEVRSLILLWGSLTAAYGGFISARQTDLKRILAYSTISHCGYMMVLVGCGNVNSLLLYFYIHGLYKALLFLVTGNIMRVYQTQDLRKMGGAWSKLPVETLTCILGFAHLSGAPFSLGYIAKHQVLILSPQSGIFGFVISGLLILGACSSVFYSLEFLRCVFFEPDKSSKLGVNSYRKDMMFTKFNNPTGKAGLLVISTYSLFALFLGNYLSFILVECSLFTSVVESYDYLTSAMDEASRVSLGYKHISRAALACYMILITFWLYITSSNKRELLYPRVLYWSMLTLAFTLSFTTVQFLVSDFYIYNVVAEELVNMTDELISKLKIRNPFDGVFDLKTYLSEKDLVKIKKFISVTYHSEFELDICKKTYSKLFKVKL